MIRIAHPEPVRQRVDREVPTWSSRAADRLATALAAGHVGEGDAIWSEIKGIFIRDQHYKCAYCELAMANIETGSTSGIGVDYDVEHFRPKNRVTQWPAPAHLARRPGLSYAGQVRQGSPDGYVRLAFELENYLVSCKLCNSFYKGDRFPIAGAPDSAAVSKRDLDASELPLLLYPAGLWPDDPVRFLDFSGCIMHPRAGIIDHDLLRARTVIDFFELDSREDLLDGRAQVIITASAPTRARGGGQ